MQPETEIEKTPEMTDEPEDGDWSGVLPPLDTDEEGDEIIPPAPPIEGEENAEEKTNDDDDDDDDDDDLDIVEDTDEIPGALVEEENTVMPMVNPYKPRAPPKSPQKDDEEVPDFSQYKTNVAERLWRARKEAEKLGATAGPHLIPLTQEYQLWRKQMGILNKYIAEYKAAMHDLSEKRNQLFTQYAKMTEDTPLFDHIGKPLIAEQKSEAEQSGEFIESRTKSIMKVAEQIGPGSLVAHQQLSVMHQKLDEVDFDNHVVDYIDEWEMVVTSQLDDEVKAIRELAKNRGKYFEKVGKLRVKVNSIEHRRKKDAPKKLTDQLDRNEKKLEECDVLYEKKANEVSIELYEATRRSWVDLYPVIKNAMKFEINRVGRESSTYGSFHNTLDALKIDYKDATKDTADAPNTGSAL